MAIRELYHSIAFLWRLSPGEETSLMLVCGAQVERPIRWRLVAFG